ASRPDAELMRASCSSLRAAANQRPPRATQPRAARVRQIQTQRESRASALHKPSAALTAPSRTEICQNKTRSVEAPAIDTHSAGQISPSTGRYADAKLKCVAIARPN